MMHVGLVVPGFGLGSTGGVQVHARELIRALLRHDRSGNAYTLLIGPDDEAPALDGLRVARLPLPSRGPGWLRAARALVASTRALDALELDVLHCPATRVPAPLPCLPVVLTFFDMQEEFLPGLFSRRERWARRVFHRRGVRRADLVIAPSRFTAECLRARYATPESKLRVVSPGVADVFFDAPAPGDAARLLALHGLTAGEYALYPANPWPHKDHATLLGALARLDARPGGAPLLVCTGRLRSEPRRVAELAAQAGLRPERVRDLGFVPEHDLPLLLRGARLLAFPSLFEGFGLPVAEAAAAGCPVLASDIPPLRESAGDAARFVAPGDVAAWAAALGALWDDAATRAHLAAAGRARAAACRWEALVPRMVAVYREAVALSRRAG